MPHATAKAAVAAIPPEEMFRDGLLDVAAAIEFSRKSRNELFDLMNEGVLPWRRGKRLCRCIPRRALSAILAHEWEASETPELLPVPTPQPAARIAKFDQRVPLAAHRWTLMAFLKENGPSTRKVILDRTDIPAGSLSAILGGKDFEQSERGWWALREQAKEATPTPQPSYR